MHIKYSKKIFLAFSCFFLLFLAFSCKVKGIVLDKEAIEVGLGESESIVATISPKSAAKKNISWKSSDVTIVSVDANGKITGEALGKATITAYVDSIEATCEVSVVSNFFITTDDVEIRKMTASGYESRIFESEEEFIDKLKRALPVTVSFTIADIILKSIDYDTSCFLEGQSLFSVGSPISSGVLGVWNNFSGAAEQTYSKVFSFVVTVKEYDIEFKWKTTGTDEFTLPSVGTVAFADGDFFVSNVSENSFDLTLFSLREKIVAAFPGQIPAETGDGTFSMVVKEGATVLGSFTDQGIPALGEEALFSIGPLSPLTAYNISVEITLTLTSGESPNIQSNFTKLVTTLGSPIVISGEITPCHISIARVTDERGVPEAEVSALLNYGAEMEYLFKTEVSNYDDYDFNQATWSASFMDGSTTVVATVTDAPYKKRVVVPMDLTHDYHVKVNHLKIFVPKKADNTLIQPFHFTWGGDAVLGDSILVKNTAEFPESIYIDTNHLVQSTGTKYNLVFADDFNYHFNGLNYKTRANYDAVKENENSDKEAYCYNKKWSTPKPSVRRKTSWDFRTTETKNSLLYQKVLSSDFSTGEIFLGIDKTKPVSGYSDLLSDTSDRKILTGESQSRNVRFGYTEARIRVKAKGYGSNRLSGPWYAFWLHGDMHEYDTMEFLGVSGKASSVTHWHNGWGEYGPTKMNQGTQKYFENKIPTYETEWFTLAVYWDETHAIYYCNGEKFKELVANSDNSGVSGGPSNAAAWPTSYKGNCDPEIGGTGVAKPYDSDHMKGIMDVPLNIHVSTECGYLVWGGGWTNVETKAPTWIEVDYVAYYLPEASLTDITINGNDGTDLLLNGTRQLTVGYTPSYTSEKGVTWSTSDSHIATVDANGLVTAVGVGLVEIKATSTVNSSIYGTTPLNVVSSIIPVESISVSPTTLDLNVDDNVTSTLTATIEPSNASNRDMTWATDNANVATVDNNGIVTAVGAGSAIITVTSVADSTKTSSCTVTVARKKVMAPNKIAMFSGDYNLVKAFDFEDDDADFVMPADVTRNDGLISVVPNVNKKYILSMTNIPDCNFIAIRMKADYAYNSYFGINNWWYTFARSAGIVWTCDNSWASTASNRVNTGWTYGNDWDTYYIQNNGALISYFQNGINKIDTSAGTVFSDSLQLILENSNGDSIGDHEIEYIAFYKGSTASSTSAPASLNIDSDTLTKVESFDFEDTNAKVNLSSNMSLDDKKLIVTNNLGNSSVLALSSLQNFSCVLIKFKYNGFSPNFDFNVGATKNFYNYFRPTVWHKGAVVFSNSWSNLLTVENLSTHVQDTWITIAVYKKDVRLVYFVNNGSWKSGSASEDLDEFGNELNFYFRDNDGGTNGTIEVEYIATYQ